MSWGFEPECDHCARELDEDDAEAGLCVCGCAVPREVKEHFEKKAKRTVSSVSTDKEG